MSLRGSTRRCLAGALLLGFVVAADGSPAVTRYSGMCDASAAVAVGSTMFAVANDEDNVLRVYPRNHSGGPMFSFDLAAFLDIDQEHPEADIEGATAIGDRIYWITSHGANKKGKPRPNRRRLFATELSVEGDKVILTPIGVPYRDLVDDLAESPELKGYQLGKAANVAPEEAGGLNIEGLSRTPQGGLLIGFRNPLPDGKALIVPLENPADVVDGKPAKLGSPMTLSLGGLGIRSMEYFGPRGSYLIVAGPHDDEGDFQLFAWSGHGDDAEMVRGVEFGGLRPEAIVIYPGEIEKIQVVSDDGTEQVGGRDCKDPKVEAVQKSFRSIWANP